MSSSSSNVPKDLDHHHVSSANVGASCTSFTSGPSTDLTTTTTTPNVIVDVDSLPADVRDKLAELKLELSEGDITNKGYEKKKNKLLAPFISNLLQQQQQQSSGNTTSTVFAGTTVTDPSKHPDVPLLMSQSSSSSSSSSAKQQQSYQQQQQQQEMPLRPLVLNESQQIHVFQSAAAAAAAAVPNGSPITRAKRRQNRRVTRHEARYHSDDESALATAVVSLTENINDYFKIIQSGETVDNKTKSAGLSARHLSHEIIRIPQDKKFMRLLSLRREYRVTRRILIVTQEASVSKEIVGKLKSENINGCDISLKPQSKVLKSLFDFIRGVHECLVIPIGLMKMVPLYKMRMIVMYDTADKSLYIPEFLSDVTRGCKVFTLVATREAAISNNPLPTPRPISSPTVAPIKIGKISKATILAFESLEKIIVTLEANTGIRDRLQEILDSTFDSLKVMPGDLRHGSKVVVYSRAWRRYCRAFFISYGYGCQGGSETPNPTDATVDLIDYRTTEKLHIRHIHGPLDIASEIFNFMKFPLTHDRCRLDGVKNTRAGVSSIATETFFANLISQGYPVTLYARDIDHGIPSVYLYFKDPSSKRTVDMATYLLENRMASFE